MADVRYKYKYDKRRELGSCIMCTIKQEYHNMVQRKICTENYIVRNRLVITMKNTDILFDPSLNFLFED